MHVHVTGHGILDDTNAIFLRNHWVSFDAHIAIIINLTVIVISAFSDSEAFRKSSLWLSLCQRFKLSP